MPSGSGSGAGKDGSSGSDTGEGFCSTNEYTLFPILWPGELQYTMVIFRAHAEPFTADGSLIRVTGDNFSRVEKTAENCKGPVTRLQFASTSAFAQGDFVGRLDSRIGSRGAQFGPQPSSPGRWKLVMQVLQDLRVDADEGAQQVSRLPRRVEKRIPAE